MRRPSYIYMQLLFVLAVAVKASDASANGSITLPVVGEVSFVLGKAYITDAGGKEIRIGKATAVHAGDVIETSAGGHVHIRFVDDELVSVRPSSTLEIVRYDYDAQNPQNSAVKLNLVEGVTRAISGKAAQANRQNFRLNTPIAAIGVRGTDFAVSASATSMRAFVNEGAIVVAPFSNVCSAESLGPCSQDAVELSGLSRQILELNSSAAGVSSALLPASTPQAQALVAEVAASSERANAANNKPADGKELYTDTVTSRVVNTTLATTAEVAKPAPAPQTAQPIVVAPVFTPTVAETPTALTTNNQLVWGRWLERNLESERITVSYDIAVQNGRKSTVGNTLHALFRTETTSKSLQPGLGVLSFNLLKAQAHYNAGGRIDLMQVNGGDLKLDFNEMAFSTSLKLSHAATGNIVFSDSGRIFGDGVFRNNTTLQTTAGAVSFDGKEAGYFFEKILENGTLEGLTLWGLPPK